MRIEMMVLSKDAKRFFHNAGKSSILYKLNDNEFTCSDLENLKVFLECELEATIEGRIRDFGQVRYTVVEKWGRVELSVFTLIVAWNIQLEGVSVLLNVEDREVDPATFDILDKCGVIFNTQPCWEFLPITHNNCKHWKEITEIASLNDPETLWDYLKRHHLQDELIYV